MIILRSPDEAVSTAPPPTSTQTPTEKAPEGSYGDVFKQLDDLDSDDNSGKAYIPDKQKKKNAERTVPAPEKTEAKTGERVEEKTGEKPAEKAPEGESKVATPPADDVPKTTAQLRRAYDEMKPQYREATEKLATAQKRIAELEAVKPDDTIPNQLETLKKENERLQQLIEFSDYRESDRFQKEYQRPYNEAWAEAVEEIGQLKVNTESGETRKATEADLLALANAPLDQMDELAEQWFGKSAARVIRHVENCKKLARAQERALHEAKTSGGERKKQILAAQENYSKQNRTLYDQTVKELETKYPRWFAADPADKEASEQFAKGRAFSESLETDQTLTGPQRIQRLATIKLKAANHDRLALLLKRERAAHAATKQSLEAFEKSKPNAGGDSAPSGGGNGDGGVNAEFDAIDRKYANL